MSATADISRYKDYFKDLGRGERVEVLAIPNSNEKTVFQRSVSYLEQAITCTLNAFIFFSLVHMRCTYQFKEYFFALNIIVNMKPMTLKNKKRAPLPFVFFRATFTVTHL